jgi:bifunctional non-homologous end joining protein LigD
VLHEVDSCESPSKQVPAKARFIEPMLLLRTEKLPDGPQWVHELKFDGYRALAIKSGGKVHLCSRNDNDFNGRYPGVVKALGAMSDDTVIDGEVVALDRDGKPSFNLLQNYSSAGNPLHFFIFEVLVLKGQDVMGEPLVKRRELLEEHVSQYGRADPLLTLAGGKPEGSHPVRQGAGVGGSGREASRFKI